MRQHRFRAPLSFDSKRFFRGCKTTPKANLPLPLLKTILLSLYIFFLLAIDFVLFTDSGNLNIFRGEWLISPEVLILLVVLLIFSFAVMALCSLVRWLQNIVSALFTFWFIIVLFNQFAQFNTGSFLGEAIQSSFGSFTPTFLYTSSDITLAVILSGLVLWFLCTAPFKALFVYVAMFFIAFIGILRYGFNSSGHQHDFIELNQTQLKTSGQAEGEKFIYIMLPNLMSYKSYMIGNNPQDQEMTKLITGFYAKNNFEVFSNAYHDNNDLFLNMVKAVNVFGHKDPREYITNTMMVYRYWKFFNVNDEHIFLKDNQMFDTFRQAGYKISAYKSRGFDMCHKNHKFNVDRCIEKLNRPVNVYSMNIGRFPRAKLLLLEWFSSMKILKDLSKIYQALNTFTQADNLPMIGVNYNNLYVLNSAKTFDVLAENIIADKGRQAYFVYADIPSDMFIYDQYCRIKPQDEWISLEDLPWVNVNKAMMKRTAYNDQTKCLYAKFQELFDKLETAGILQKSVIIIEGMSSVNNFNQHYSDDFINRFTHEKLTTLAVRSPVNTALTVNPRLCPTENLVSTYLYKTESCRGVENVKIHQRFKEELMHKLQLLEIPVPEMENNRVDFDLWYNQWRQVNEVGTQNDIHIIYGEKNRDHSSMQNALPELQNETLQ